MERKLAAIFSADVKGYSRLMGDDEIATVRTLTTYREVMTNLIQAYRGRVVDSPGDNLLAEFASVVDAVQCATEIQKELMVRNAELLPHRQMAFRIGINVGDVLTEDGRLYGDGVNIAARLEGLAEAGGICLSETAYTQIKNKLALGYEYIGEQQVKNIAEPVRAYNIQLNSGMTALDVSQQPEAAKPVVQPGRSTIAPWNRRKTFSSWGAPPCRCGGPAVSLVAPTHTIRNYSLSAVLPSRTSRQTLHCRAALCQHE
ncbi:MAG: adenylate/guanylate cyclase domain-containing protein [Candidatus Binatia bacterium]